MREALRPRGNLPPFLGATSLSAMRQSPRRRARNLLSLSRLSLALSLSPFSASEPCSVTMPAGPACLRTFSRKEACPRIRRTARIKKDRKREIDLKRTYRKAT